MLLVLLSMWICVHHLNLRFFDIISCTCVGFNLNVFPSVWVARRPPGYAFIDFDDRRDAQDAIRELDSKMPNLSLAYVQELLAFLQLKFVPC